MVSLSRDVWSIFLDQLSLVCLSLKTSFTHWLSDDEKGKSWPSMKMYQPASDDGLAALSDLAELPLELLPVDVVVGHDGVERRAVHDQAGGPPGVPTNKI